MNIEIRYGDHEPDLLSQSLTGRASTWLGFWRGSPARRRVRQRGRSNRENRFVRDAMQRRCAKPGRRLCFDVAWPLARARRQAATASRANQTARTAAPATRRNDVARIGEFRHFTGSMNFGTTPRGLCGQARNADHPQNRRAQPAPRSRARWRIRRQKQWVGTKNGSSSKGTSSKSRSRAAAAC
jgi:hypothetical protein